MKRLLLALSVIASGPALADHSAPEASSAESYYVYADVVDVDPIVKRRVVRTPREVCDEPTRYVHNDHDYDARNDRHDEPGPVPSILGGLIGGFIGNQISHGKRALTIAAAIAGASIAKATARKNRRERHARRHRYAEKCRTVTDEEIVKSTEGYRVTYDYHGRRFVKEMDSYPDEQIRVRVKVSPEF